MQSGGQGAGIQLQVGLDLAYFRNQLPSLGTAAAGYRLPIVVKFDPKSIKNELKALDKINATIRINDSQIDAARARLGTLNKSLATLRRATATPIEIKVKYKEEGAPAGGSGSVGRTVLGRAGGQEVLANKSRAELQKLYGLFRQANLQVGELSKSLASASADELRTALVPAFSDSGEEAVNGLAIGLKDSSSKVSKAAARLAKETIQDVKKIFGIASPSRVFKEIGQDIVDGLEVGLEDFNQLKTKIVGEMRQLIAAVKREAKVGGIAIGGLLSPIAVPPRASARTIPGVSAPRDVVSRQDPGRSYTRMLNSLSLLTGDPKLYRGRMANLGANRLPSSLLGSAATQMSLEEMVPSFRQSRLEGTKTGVANVIDEAFFGRGTLPKASSALSGLSNALERLASSARAAVPSGILQSASGSPRFRGFGGVPSSQSMGIFSPTARAATYPPSGGFLEFSRRATAISAGLPGNVFGGRSGPPRSPTPRPPLGGASFPFDGMMGPSTTKSYEALARLSGALRESSSFFNRTRLPLAGAVEELGAEFAQATKQVLLYGTAYKALAFVTDLPAQALNASKALQTFNNQLEAITGSAANADRSFAFVDGLATRFNVPLDSARQGFVKLYASMAPAGFSEEQIQNLFGGISKASATLGLSADKVDRVTYAFAQMASKGQLMAEEVTGQLGDVIPGALSIMADAAKMDIATFKKAMEDGTFTGKTFEQVMSNVPIVLEQRFGKGAIGAANTLQGALNSMTTATIKFYEAFEPVVSIAAANVFPLMAEVFNQATQSVKAFGASLQGSNGPANMLEGNALRIYTALQQFGQIGLAVANILKTLAPTFELVGRSILFTADLLARLINTPVGKFLTELITKAGLALIAFQLLARTGIGVLIGQLVILVRNVQLAGTGFAGLTAAIKGSALAARAFRLAITGLIAGGILMGLEALVTQIGRVANRLGDARKKALDAASAIRSMSSAELVRERTLKQKDVALLQKVERQGGRIDTEAERKRLEELGLQTGTRGLQRMVIDPTMIPGIRQREEGLLAEVNYAYKNLDQVAVPMQLGDVDLGAGGDGKKEKDKAIKDASQLNRLIQQELETRNRLGLIGKDELSQIEEKAELAKEILALTLKDIRLTETGAIQTQSITNATLAYQVTVAELNEEWDKAIKKIDEVEKEGRELYKSILEQRNIEQSPLQKALVEIENQTEASIEKINELMSVLNAQAGLRPEGLAARAALGNMRSALQQQTPEQINLRASQKTTQPIKKDLESQLQGLLNAGKTLTTLDEIIIKIGEDWSALSPQVQGDLAELAGRIDAAKPFAEIASAIRESREELTKMTSTSTLVISSANSIGDAFGTAFKGVITGSMTAQEALAGFFQNIADSFADMVAKMIAEWLKAQLIQGFMSLLPGGNALAGFNPTAAGGDWMGAVGKMNPTAAYANGGIAPGGFQAFANGGIVTGPTLGLVGEGRYNEAVIPLPDGRSVPVELSGGGSSSPTVIVNVDAKGSQVEGNEQNANQLGRVISAAVQTELIKQQRPGGLLASRR